MNAYMKYIEKREGLCEASNDDKESISIEKYTAKRLKKETLFGCSNHRKRNPESFNCLGMVLSRFSAEREWSRT